MINLLLIINFSFAVLMLQLSYVVDTKDVPDKNKTVSIKDNSHLCKIKTSFCNDRQNQKLIYPKSFKSQFLNNTNIPDVPHDWDIIYQFEYDIELPAKPYILNQNNIWTAFNYYYDDEFDVEREKLVISKSENGGLTWESIALIDLDDTDFTPHRTYFISESIGWIVGSWIVGNVSTAVLLKTEDGGFTWDYNHIEQSYGNSIIEGLSFFDENNGWAFGSGASGNLLLLHTSDVGETWEEVFVDNRFKSGYEFEGFANDTDKILVVAFDSEQNRNVILQVAKMDDEVTWEVIFVGSNNDEVFYNFMVDDTGTFWSAGFNYDELHPFILKSSDSGLNWDYKVLPFDLDVDWYFIYHREFSIFDIHTFNESIWVLGWDDSSETSMIFYSFDSGDTWQVNYSNWMLSKIHFFSNIEGILFGSFYGYPDPSVTVVFEYTGNIVSVPSKSELPYEVILSQNYPNPFNPVTNIQYFLPEPSFVTLNVYNMLGQRVAALVTNQKQVGTHTVVFDASNLGSGMYFYRLSAGNTVETRKMLLVK